VNCSQQIKIIARARTEPYGLNVHIIAHVNDDKPVTMWF